MTPPSPAASGTMTIPAPKGPNQIGRTVEWPLLSVVVICEKELGAPVTPESVCVLNLLDLAAKLPDEAGPVKL